MFKGLSIAVIIPCFKVEEHIADVVNTIPDYVDFIIAVNDASPDRAADILAQLTDPRLIVLTHPANRGLGAAMATGFEKALEVQADIVVKLDGDGQMLPEFMQHLIEPIVDNACDYAKGNRFRHTRALSQMPKARLFGSIGLTVLTKIASGYWNVTDPQNGYIAISAEFLKSLDFNRIAKRRFFFENEMLIQLNVEEARVLDVPLPAVYGDEQSTMSAGRVLFGFPPKLMLGYLWRFLNRFVIRDFSLIAPLYIFGIILMTYGLYTGISAWNINLAKGIVTPTGTIIKATIPLILGFQMVMQGLLLEILATPKPDLSKTHRHHIATTNRRAK